MPRLESPKKLLCRWFTSIPFFAVLGVALGFAIALPALPTPRIAIIPISGILFEQSQADDISAALKSAADDNSVKAVVLQIDSPGGGASVTEQVYLDMLRLRGRKPVVASIGTIGASGGYYIAVAADFIYAQPTSQLGSIGVWSGLPSPEKLDETIITSGLFKATRQSKRQALAEVEMVRQEFVSAVVSQRGARLKLASEELSLAVLYPGVEALRYGLIDDIGTITTAVKKAASLANLRNYEITKLEIPTPLLFFFFTSADMEKLKSQTGLIPRYYYLYFESE